MIFKIEYIGPQTVENAPFTIDRPDGSYRYIFFHFISPVTLVIDNQKVDAIPGTCILFTPRKEQKFFVEKNRLNQLRIFKKKKKCQKLVGNIFVMKN